MPFETSSQAPTTRREAKETMTNSRSKKSHRRANQYVLPGEELNLLDSTAIDTSRVNSSAHTMVIDPMPRPLKTTVDPSNSLTVNPSR